MEGAYISVCLSSSRLALPDLAPFLRKVKVKSEKVKVEYRKRATFAFNLLPFAFPPVVAEASSGRSLRLSG
jgi:hypothetical protein